MLLHLCLGEGVESGCLCPNVPSSLSSCLLHMSALDKKADCTITMADSDLLALMTGKMNPQSVSAGAPTQTGQTFVGPHRPGY